MLCTGLVSYTCMDIYPIRNVSEFRAMQYPKPQSFLANPLACFSNTTTTRMQTLLVEPPPAALIEVARLN
jgi:hypothetical protein